MLVISLAAIVGVLAVIKFYKWATQFSDYFEKHGIKYVKPPFLIGNTGKLILNSHAPNVYYKQLYDSFPNERLFGIFDFRKPLFFVRDPELIKQIGVKDFEHFVDHQKFAEGSSDDMFSNSLFMLSGDKWRDMRATLSPAFTGSKMRQMFILVRQCAADMSNYLKQEAAVGKHLNYEMKDLFSKYSTNVIATSAFGIEVNSFEDPKNEFFLVGKEMMNFNLALAMKFLLIRIAPWVMRVFKLDLFGARFARFFKTMVMENIQNRIKHNIFRPDMINILKDIVKQGGVQSKSDEVVEIADGFSAVEESDVGTKTVVKRKWNETELTAQCFLFFAAGFDTTSTMLTFSSYELAINTDIQERLYAEILETEKILDGRPVGYEDIQKMKYMDMFISEMLRLWPPVMNVDRLCVKDYQLEYNNNTVTIEKGTVAWFPIHALHHDSKYFKNPEKCDPERFSDENKNNILAGTYLPFGIGPRNCIGSRFALMEIKAVLYALLLNFKFEPNADTQIPLKLEKSLTVKSEKGVNLTFTPRQ